MHPPPAILPQQRKEWFCRLFQWYSRRLILKNFNAVRIEPASDKVLESLDTHEGPTMLLLNHQSWWDPILSAALARQFSPGRQVFAPMDRVMVKQFAFMRRLGIFGVDLDDPSAYKGMVQYATDLARHHPRPSFWITPQGRFVDVRAPLELRPGAAAIAGRLHKFAAPPRVVCLAVEYPFWDDRKPELLLLARPCPTPPRPTTSLWHREMSRTLAEAMHELSKLAIARKPKALDILFGRGASGVNPVYDTILRITGRQTAISTQDSRAEPSP